MSGRVVKIAVARGQSVEAGATLLVIDNPELLAELRQAEAEKTVADAKLQRIKVGTRSEIIAHRTAGPRSIAKRLPDGCATDLQPKQAAHRRQIRAQSSSTSKDLMFAAG